MSIEQIVAIMDKLNTMHRSLLKLAYSKTEVLKTSNIEELEATMKNEQAHIAAISQLESQRQKAVLAYFQNRQIVVEDTNITTLMTHASSEEVAQLEQRRKDLLLTIDTLKNQNDLNQKMMFSSLQFVNFTLDILRPQPDQINYKSASGSRQTIQSGQFDSQA
ncbi:flagellar protein FlgN [Kurthia sibirica]|uniref:Flagellar protein FlgN n=1 Tax=Kurthia sibirica TaxID=202750 RepID=A0A2U3AMR5_9BACL|nr:flagellar protein FlgN [Kurthia sibirica]PWI25789.1 flagellar protein FlgN [Kurthia sibirica]GEK35097.1 hypothetical protein KSI01_26300 [Kurthia sibirica]